MPYKSHALKIGSTWIGGILQSSAMNAARVESSPTAGSVYPLQININEIKDSFMFTSYNIATALGLLGLIGAPLGGGTTAELYEIQWTNAGQIAAGSVHRKLVFAEGRAVPRRLTARHREDAQLEIEIFGLSADGLTNPLTITEGVAVPTAIDDARHTLHSGVFGGVNFGCIQSLEFDFGNDIQSAGCTSNLFDSRLAISSIVPKITIQTLDANIVGTGGSQIPNIGKAGTHLNSSFKLRKRQAKIGAFVADGTAQHVVITCDGVAVPTTMFEGSANEDGTTTIEITGAHDGTNLPFVINTASVLT